MRLAALALAALVLAACESNQERSAKLEKVAKLHEGDAARRRALAQRALTITRPSTKVKVTGAMLVRGPEGAAAVVTLRNVSATPLRDLPVQITVRDARGASVYTNAVAGLSPTLASVALIPAHAQLTWIDDQVQATGAPASVTAKVGEGAPAGGAVPRLRLEGTHLSEAQAEGSLVNDSRASQQEVIVDAVARRAGRIVAAGRAVLASAPAGASTPFQIFFVGDPSGAQLEVSAPATTLG
ncbi:MAG: hypothetical protein JWN10_1790 [Solirubrobacterales bacterium]|nr:hypothetical protein [Solirubrobacterales bacterium]